MIFVIAEKIVAAMKSAEHKPVCPTCYGRGWDEEWDCQNDFRAVTCPDCSGSGKAEHSITVHESGSTGADVSALVEALTELCDEIDKHEIHATISNTNISWFKGKARNVLANQQEKSK